MLVILWIKPLNFDKVNLPKKITQKRICGYDYDDKIPDESTFSRAFSEFAEMNICEKHHNYLIENHLGNKIIGHISRDSTAIESHEIPVKCNHLYSLMDAAYDAESIHNFIKSNGKIPIIDENKRKKEKIGFDPAKKGRFKIRSTVERCNSHLKDWLFSQAIFVKGYKKIFEYLMFGILCLSVMKILQYKY